MRRVPRQGHQEAGCSRAGDVQKPSPAGGGVRQGGGGGPDLRNVALQGQYSIKVEALVRRILALYEARSDEKVLVFSQFPTALKLVGKALSLNGIKYKEMLAGGRCVFLILTRAYVALS